MTPTEAGRLRNEFISARKDRGLVVLEGFHALKHAWRFGAELLRIATVDRDGLYRLAHRLAPDVAEPIAEAAVAVGDTLFAQLAPRPPETGVIALARRPAVDGRGLLLHRRAAPLVVLEEPSHLGNVGAVVRVAAGAGAAGVVTTGRHDPWGPDAVRGGAGLQFALPVAQIAEADRVSAGGGPIPLRQRHGPLVVLDPEGVPLAPDTVPSDAIIAFGSERAGLSPFLLEEADARVAIPMEPGVSSLNLATSVAVVLYTWRLQRPDRRP